MAFLSLKTSWIYRSYGMTKAGRKVGSARNQQSFSRRSRAVRRVNRKVLILCQGKATEYKYCLSLRSHLKLVGTSIEIPEDSHGRSAANLLALARTKIKRESKRGDAYDKVFLVFDRDEDPSFDETIQNVKAKQLNKICDTCYSVPCFEYWLLLHFEKSRRPFQKLNGSHSQEIIRELKIHLPDFSKAKFDAFHYTIERVEAAIENAEWALENANATSEINPSTRMHVMVKYLMKLS